MGTAPTWEEYRRRRRALELAARAAAAGRFVEIDTAVFSGGDLGRAELAAAAQSEWWQRLLGRIDCDFDGDPTGFAQEECAETVRRAWALQARDMSGYLALAWACPGDARVRRDGLRYARLLAMFAGLARPEEPPVEAARRGLAFIEELDGLVPPAPLEPRTPRRQGAAGRTTRRLLQREANRLDPVA